MRPTARGVGFLVLAAVTFVAAPMFGLPALQHITALLLGLVVLAAGFVVVGSARVDVDRSFHPAVVDPGSASSVRLRVTNLRALPSAGGRWTDTLPAALSGPARGTLPPLGGARSGAGRADVEYAIRGLRRGRHAVGPFTLEVEDPFGLVVRRRAVGRTHEVVVLPRRTSIAGGVTAARQDGGASRPAPQQVGVGTDDVIARAYLPGDALKRVHWKASARRGELMVRQEEQQTDPRTAIVLDTDDVSFGTAQDRAGRWDHSADLEWAVSAAASLLTHLVQQGHDVVFRAVGQEPQQITEHAGSIHDVLVDLAELEPSTRQDVTRESSGTGERHLVVLLGRPDVARAHAWARATAGADVMALLARSTRQDALDVLEAAGWRTATYASGDALDERWAALREAGRRAAS